MDSKFLFFLLIGNILMMAVVLFCRRWYSYAIWKLLCIIILLTIDGIIGVKLLYYIERGTWGGMSYFGGVFLCPVIFALAKPLLRMPYGDIMDLCAPAGCIVFAVMKLNCYLDGCCYGRILTEVAGVQIRFPSQFAEAACSFVLMILLLLLMRNGKHRGKIHPLYLIAYGGSRFLLSLFRDEPSVMLGITIRGIWALLSIAIGIIWLLALKKMSVRKTEETL